MTWLRARGVESGPRQESLQPEVLAEVCEVDIKERKKGAGKFIPSAWTLFFLWHLELIFSSRSAHILTQTALVLL